MHLHVLLKSTALLEALPTDLAVEVGVLPGLALPPSSGTGGNLPHQVLLALEFLLAASASKHHVTLHLEHMHLQFYLALECSFFFTLITAIWGPMVVPCVVPERPAGLVAFVTVSSILE